MNHYRNAIAALSLLALAGAALGADAITPGKLDIDPPTLIGGGFQWWMTGDENHNARLKVVFRRKGRDAWQSAPAPSYHPKKTYGGYNPFTRHYPVDAHFAGSIIDLEEAATYEVQLTLTDPDGIGGSDAPVQRRFEFTTRTVPQACSQGRKVEVFPDGKGPGLAQAIEELKPGDTILLHAGTYNPPAFDAGPTKVSQREPVELPAPERVLHVYPENHKGPKLQPNFESLLDAYTGGHWEADFNYQAPQDPIIRDDKGQIFGAQPGDTILVHPGTYAGKPFSVYHHYTGLWPTGAHYMSRKGTAEKPIVIKAAEGGEVIIDGNGAYRLFDLRNAAHHVLDGLTIRNAYVGIDAGDGRNSMAGENILVQNCTFEQVHRGVIGKDVTVLASKVSEGAFADRFEGTWTIETDGTAEKPIAFIPFGDGDVILDGKGTYLMLDTMSADHLIFDSLTFQNAYMTIEAGGRFGQLGATGLTVKRCRFRDISIGIFGLEGSCRSFTIVDNHLTGRLDGPNNGGYGVNLSGAGHSVAYNRVEQFWDCLNVLTSSTTVPGQRAWSMDFNNNICIAARDNIFEIDGMMWNVRFMRNLTGYSNSFGFSSQPTYAGPGYYLRNILYRGSAGKALRSGDIHYYHNTVVGKAGIIKNALNNAFLAEGLQNGPLDFKDRPVVIARSGRDLAYSAWRMGGQKAPQGFIFGRTKYDTFQKYVSQKNVHDVLVDFNDFADIPNPWSNEASSRRRIRNVPHDITEMNFAPKPRSPVIDAGKRIDGINDDFKGKAPDIGAVELGRPPVHYGPRPQENSDSD